MSLSSSRKSGCGLRWVRDGGRVVAGQIRENVGVRALYEQAVDTDDRSAEGRLGLARVALATGHADEAEAEGRRAVTLRPSAIG